MDVSPDNTTIVDAQCASAMHKVAQEIVSLSITPRFVLCAPGGVVPDESRSPDQQLSVLPGHEQVKMFELLIRQRANLRIPI